MKKPNGYWNYNRCYEEAKKYSTISEFGKKCGSALHSAKKNGWIKDYTWFIDGRKLSAQKRTIWTYDACYELAKLCNKKSEMKNKNIRAYQVALKNDWFSDYTWFLNDDEIRHQKRPSRVKWPYEKCKELALQFSTLAEFNKAYPSVCTISKRNGWIDDFDWFKRSGNIYMSKIDNVYAYLFEEFNSVYIGRTIDPSSRDLGHNNNEKSTVLRFASDNNISVPKMTILESGLTIMEGLDREDYYRKKYQSEGWNVLNIAKTGIKSGSLGGLGSGKWNYKSCYKEAKKYKTLKDFRKKSPAAYNVVCKNKWQDDYEWLKTIEHKGGYWTYEKCYKEAEKYKTRTEFQKNSRSAYVKSLKEKWIDDYFWFLTKRNNWTYDNVLKEAKKYMKLSDFIKNSGGAYNASRKNGWLNDFTWLNKKDISKKRVIQFSLDLEFIKEYEGVRQASRETGINNASISRCCNCKKLKTAGGSIWKYKDVA